MFGLLISIDSLLILFFKDVDHAISKLHLNFSYNFIGAVIKLK